MTIGERIETPSPLEHFVTARWGMYSSAWRGRLRYAAVDHAPWPLHRATVDRLDDSLVTAAGLPAPTGEPLCVYSPGVSVRVGRSTRR